MQLKNLFILISALILLFCNKLTAAPGYTTTKLEEIGAVELQLANGIKVLIKPIEDSDEILVHGVAAGGYSVLAPEQRSSGKVAASIAWESGFGKWNCNEVSNKLLKDSLELEIAVAPFHRTLDGAAFPSKLKNLLGMIRQLYSAPQFDSTVAPEVLSRLRDSVTLRHRDPETLFEDVIRSINTGDLAILHPITHDDLDQVDVDIAKRYYFNHFLATDNLTFLLVGQINLNEVIPLVVEHLGAIPKRQTPPSKETTPLLSVPIGLTKREVPSPYLQECLMRMTYSLSFDLTETSWQQLETVSQVIETRLRQRFREAVGATQGIDVAYEFPYYPNNSSAWLTVQFRCPGCKSDKLAQIVREELALLQSVGPTRQELEKVRLQQMRNDEFWLDSKNYWVQLLSNYYLWNLDPRNAIKNHANSTHHEPEVIRNFIKNHLELNNYTMVHLKPE